ncbi:MAG TPA: hypothetical protein VIE16_09015 [Phenylobacterium sp.]|jgi:hypothetical protein
MSEPPKPDPMNRFLGAAMIAVGGLIFGLCGLCTLTFLVAGMIPQGDRSFSVIALVVGGIPTGLGFLLLRGGLTMFRGRRRVLAPGEAGYLNDEPSQ